MGKSVFVSHESWISSAVYRAVLFDLNTPPSSTNQPNERTCYYYTSYTRTRKSLERFIHVLRIVLVNQQLLLIGLLLILQLAWSESRQPSGADLHSSDEPDQLLKWLDSTIKHCPVYYNYCLSVCLFVCLFFFLSANIGQLVEILDVSIKLGLRKLSCSTHELIWMVAWGLGEILQRLKEHL